MVSIFVGISLFLLAFDIPDAHGIRALSKPKHGKVVACYFASWATYRPGKGQFKFEDIRPEHCTHLVYAFAGLNASTSTIRSLDPWNDLQDDYGHDTYRKVVGLRQRYPHLRVSLGIGGWNEESANYSAMAASPEKRRTFVDSVVKFLKTYGFDGLDLDWEFPTKRGGVPQDKDNFVHLTRELSSAFAGSRLLLTAAISAEKETIDSAYDFRRISKYLDYIHMMAYDYYGPWNKQVLPNAPLQTTHGRGVIDSVEYALKLGAPAHKLVLGLPMYGRTFVLTTTPASNTESPIGMPSLEKGFPGPYTRGDGLIGYNEICEMLLDTSEKWKTGWDEASTTAYAMMEDKVVMYDNIKSLTAKAQFASKLNLAGVMIWSMDTDDFKGICAELHNEFLDPLEGIDFPLLRSINLALEKPSDDPEDNSIDHTSFSRGYECLSSLSIILISLITSFLRNA